MLCYSNLRSRHLFVSKKKTQQPASPDTDPDLAIVYNTPDRSIQQPSISSNPLARVPDLGIPGATQTTSPADHQTSRLQSFSPPRQGHAGSARHRTSPPATYTQQPTPPRSELQHPPLYPRPTRPHKYLGPRHVMRQPTCTQRNGVARANAPAAPLRPSGELRVLAIHLTSCTAEGGPHTQPATRVRVTAAPHPPSAIEHPREPSCPERKRYHSRYPPSGSRTRLSSHNWPWMVV